MKRSSFSKFNKPMQSWYLITSAISDNFTCAILYLSILEHYFPKGIADVMHYTVFHSESNRYNKIKVKINVTKKKLFTAKINKELIKRQC